MINMEDYKEELELELKLQGVGNDIIDFEYLLKYWF
jgi:hypothetical protein